jgi:hypothetical protein
MGLGDGGGRPYRFDEGTVALDRVGGEWSRPQKRN